MATQTDQMVTATAADPVQLSVRAESLATKTMSRKSNRQPYREVAMLTKLLRDKAVSHRNGILPVEMVLKIGRGGRGDGDHQPSVPEQGA